MELEPLILHDGKALSSKITPSQSFNIINVADEGDFYIFFPRSRRANETLGFNLTEVEFIERPELEDSISDLFQNSLLVRTAISSKKQANPGRQLNLASPAVREDYFDPELINFWPRRDDPEQPVAILVDSGEILDSPETFLRKSSTESVKRFLPFGANLLRNAGAFTRGASDKSILGGKIAKHLISEPKSLEGGALTNKFLEIADEKQNFSNNLIKELRHNGIELPFKVENRQPPSSDLLTLNSNDSLLLGSSVKTLTGEPKDSQDPGLASLDVTLTTGLSLPNNDFISQSSSSNDNLEDTTDFILYDSNDDTSDMEDIETFDMEDFNPTHFGIPSVNISEFSQVDDDLSNIKKAGGLRMDNKTATFIFILLSSISDAINFHGQPNSLNSFGTPTSVHKFTGPQTSNISTQAFSNQLPGDEFQSQFKSSIQSSGFQTQFPLAKSISSPSTGVSFPSTGVSFPSVSPSEDAPVVRLFQEIPPPSTPICESVEQPDCQYANDGYCLEDSDVIRLQLDALLKRDISVGSKYADVGNQSAQDLVPYLTKAQEDNFNYSSFNPSAYDESHWFGPEGYVCPSEVRYAKPTRAKNSKGEWKMILNDGGPHSQTIRMETCLYPETPCRLIAPCFKSKCLQKYVYHRLLVFDPCHPSKSLHVDIFRLPSSCSCYAPTFRGFDEFTFDEVT